MELCFKFSHEILGVVGTDIQGHFPHQDSVKKSGNGQVHRAVLSPGGGDAKLYQGQGGVGTIPDSKAHLLSQVLGTRLLHRFWCSLGSVGCYYMLMKQRFLVLEAWEKQA